MPRVNAHLVPAILAVALSLGACVGPVRPSLAPTRAPTGNAFRLTRVSIEAEREIRELIAHYGAAANARDLRAVMRLYAATDRLLVYDVLDAPFRGYSEVSRDWEQFMNAMRAINLEFREIEVTVDGHGEFAYATFIERASLTPIQGAPLVNDNLRTTQVYAKVGGRWLIVHEHKSQSGTW